MDELTTITRTPAGFTIVTGWALPLAAGATRAQALTALFHRGFTPQAAAEYLNFAVRLGTVTVAGLVAD